MKAEREKIHAKVKADTVRLNGSKLELTADEETCTFLLVSEGSCTLQMGENSLLLNPGSALLLGAGDAVLSAAGAAVPELVGCRFPLSALHELRSATQRDFARLFLPGEVTVLYGPVPWVRRLRTLLEMMRAAMPEQDYPGGLYLLLYKPVKAFMDKRTAYYRDQDVQAAKALADAEQTAAEVRQQLKNADAAATEKIAQAQKAADAAAEQRISEARAQAEQIIADAHTAAQREHDKLLADAEQELKDLAVTATEKLVLQSGGDAFDQFLDEAERGEPHA